MLRRLQFEGKAVHLRAARMAQGGHTESVSLDRVLPSELWVRAALRRIGDPDSAAVTCWAYQYTGDDAGPRLEWPPAPLTCCRVRGGSRWSGPDSAAPLRGC